jgi:hypothetical protein
MIFGLSMDYTWSSHGSSMYYLWIFQGLSLGYPWDVDKSSCGSLAKGPFSCFLSFLGKALYLSLQLFLISSTPNPLNKKTWPVSGDPSSFLLVAIMVCLGNHKKTCARKLSRSLWSKTYQLPWRAIWWRIRCLFFLWIIHGHSMDDPWMIHGWSMNNPWIIHGLSMDYG